MHFFINELSFNGQAKDIYESKELIKEILKIIKETDKIRDKTNLIKKHNNLANCYITPTLTLYQYLYNAQSLYRQKNADSDERTQFSRFIQTVTKGPFIDEQGLLNTAPCYYNEKDVSNSSISGAVNLQGILISLQNSDNFTAEEITINVKNEPDENVSIHNLTEIKQARKICPKYEPTSKHDSQSSWKNATKMDLNDDDAQKALNQSIKYKGLQRYSYFNDKYYRFHSENTFNDQGYPTYHGYPVDKSDIPNEVLKQLIR